jgi:hypothetical protein
VGKDKMIRGPLAREEYAPQFSGHETFPLRYGWLKKAFDAVDKERTTTAFSSEDAIAEFGVGKNMVTSMRHWAIACAVINKDLVPTPVGSMIFGENGLDPYMEHPSTLWLIHWFLAGRPDKTSCFWAFNYFQSGTFEREHLVRGLEDLAQKLGWKRAATATIKRDVECFVRLYVAKRATKGSHEDALESPLAELGLIRSIGRQDGFRFVRGAKPTIGNGVFLYALIYFWEHHSSARTLSFEAIAHEVGSPGRVFLLDEDDLYRRLQDLEDVSRGKFQWSETAGMKQVIREGDLTLDDALTILKDDYKLSENLEAANGAC